MKIGLRIIFLFLITLYSNSVISQIYSYQNFNHKSGLNFGTINCINQTEDGALYIGTDGGELIRFDGKDFEELIIDKDNNTHHFNSFDIDGENIYFSSRYSGFYLYNNLKRKLSAIHEKNLPKGEALSIIKQGEEIYFVKATGIYSASKGKLKTLYTQKLNKINIVFQTIKTQNSVYISTDQGNFILQNNKCTSLESILGSNTGDLSDLRFGYYDYHELNLFNSSLNHTLKITYNSLGEISSYSESYPTSQINEDDQIIKCHYSSVSKKIGILSQKGLIFTEVEGKFSQIKHNYIEPLKSTNSIFTDHFGDFWIGSDIKGLYKVSLEAFTKLQFDTPYLNPDIRFSYKTAFGDVLISTMSGKTFVGNENYNGQFKEFDFSIQGLVYANEKTFIGTTKGIYEFITGPNPEFIPYAFEGKRINLIYLTDDEKELWINVIGEGLFRKLGNGDIKQISEPSDKFPTHFYTAEESTLNGDIIFGTNDGPVRFSRNSNSFVKISIDKTLGSFMGNSTTDIYGTSWFTINQGLIGFTKKGTTISIKSNNYLSSNLLYTLSSDKFGNLIVGSNKGIDILKVNSDGKVINSKNYNKDSGFLGFETHMRSSFSNDEVTYLGTVEGLFSVNTSILESLKPPTKPWIELIQAEKNIVSNTSTLFKVGVYNSKFGVNHYQYRIKGIQSKWKSIKNPNSIIIDGLSNGDYFLEVRASYDGVNFGPTRKIKFYVNLPIWKTNWFIILVLVVVILINLFLINQNRIFNTSKLLDRKDAAINIFMAPTVILFSALSVSGSHLIAPLLDDSLTLHLGPTISVSFILFVTYFISLNAKRKNNQLYIQHYLFFALSVITIHFYYELFISHLHPFHLIGLVLTSTFAPYVLNSVKKSVYYSLGLLFFSSLCIALLGDTIYPKVYFSIANIVMICLIIISSYLRFDSIEKLLFVSGILNKGNFPAVAFDKQGKILYASDNFSKFFDYSAQNLINKKVSFLNTFIPYEGTEMKLNVTKELKDGEKYLVPMKSLNNGIIWIEWTFNNFSSEVNVIIGNDVSEKINLENTYELLVQNAEDFIYRCDINGKFQFLNDICFNKLGYEKEELIGKSSIILSSKKQRLDLIQYYKHHFQSKQKTSYREFPISKKNGDEIWVGQYMTTLFNPGSEIPNGYIALARDITQRRKSESVIREQKESITDSINYAHKIQEKLLPHDRKFKSNFADSFIFYRPKDIVSGDFYWYEKVENNHYLVLADCTGHGVPGAFMTLLGTNMLNTIVLENGHRDPGKILDLLHKRLTELLPQKENSSHDGMEVVLCMFNDTENELSFASAGGRFFICHNNHLTMLKGDNNHIGDELPVGFDGYKTHFATFTKEDQLILFTDGFYDQFGGPKDKRFFFRNFVELIEDNCVHPLNNQKCAIEEKFDEWKGNEEQTDDVTVISIKKL